MAGGIASEDRRMATVEDRRKSAVNNRMSGHDPDLMSVVKNSETLIFWFYDEIIDHNGFLKVGFYLWTRNKPLFWNDGLKNRSTVMEWKTPGLKVKRQKTRLTKGLRGGVDDSNGDPF
ncbi:unnamed protein product, partial [Citrullus colocynthis]